MQQEAYTTKNLMDLFQVGAASSITRRAEREKWEAKARSGLGGGIVWLFSSMPSETQITIRTAEARQALVLHDAAVAAASSNALDTIIQTHALTNELLTDKRRQKMMAKADLVGLYLSWLKKHGEANVQKDNFILAYQGGAWPDLLETLGNLSWKSLERWKLQQRRAGDIRVLADRRGIARRGQPKLTDEHRLIILGRILDPNAPDISSCARRIRERCKAEGLYVPSEATIRRFAQKYMTECFDEWTLWREGKKAWNDKCAISLFRDWSLVEVGDVVIADGHTLNFETIDPDTGKPKRMTLLLFFDGASNHPLGWEIMPTENVACISSAFRRT